MLGRMLYVWPLLVVRGQAVCRRSAGSGGNRLSFPTPYLWFLGATGTLIRPVISGDRSRGEPLLFRSLVPLEATLHSRFRIRISWLPSQPCRLRLSALAPPFLQCPSVASSVCWFLCLTRV